MKRIITLIMIIQLVNPLFAQEETEKDDRVKRDEVKTLFGDQYVAHGGYGSFTIGYSEINGMDAIVMGGRGAWIVGHWFAMGFAGSGFLNDYSRNVDDINANLSGGYGGLLLEPILLPKLPVHISLPVVFGVGALAYTISDSYSDWSEPTYYIEDVTSFVLIEPGVELEFNVVRFFRLSFGAYYRYTSQITLYETPTDVLNGLTLGVTLKFGKF